MALHRVPVRERALRRQEEGRGGGVLQGTFWGLGSDFRPSLRPSPHAGIHRSSSKSSSSRALQPLTLKVSTTEL